jgi:hypothetical protein
MGSFAGRNVAGKKATDKLGKLALLGKQPADRLGCFWMDSLTLYTVGPVHCKGTDAISDGIPGI